MGSMTAREKRMAREKIAGEDGLFVVGTHALIQDAVDFGSLPWSLPTNSTGLASARERR